MCVYFRVNFFFGFRYGEIKTTEKILTYMVKSLYQIHIHRDTHLKNPSFEIQDPKYIRGKGGSGSFSKHLFVLTFI